MIIASAVKLDNGKVYVGKRHGDCYKQIKSMGMSTEDCIGSSQGFITDSLKFLNREQGYYHAFENNQCEKQEPFEADFAEGLAMTLEEWKPCLFSEDLW